MQPTLTDWEDNRVSGLASLGTFTVPANHIENAQLQHEHQPAGSLPAGLRPDYRRHNLAPALPKSRYAVVVNMQNVGNADTSIFAMNTHMEREPTPHLNREMQVFAKCGVKWIRAWWGWGMCEKTEGTYDFDRIRPAI